MTLTELADAVAWTEQTMSMLKVGGKWIVPRSGTVITVLSHRPKKCSVQNGEADQMIAKVLRSGGWEVTEVAASNNQTRS